MTEMLFCYCCRVHHPKEEMRLFRTRQGYRWRCLRSIEAASRNHGERDAFGQQQTALNREISRRAAEHNWRLRQIAET
ncbi:MAG: hypothetical protein KGZ68_02230 [Dechloromonas sp.]|jgi:hypothetical protein|nr:hypothetical protein [Azonexus hydrophilus]MBS4017031.1 hypothetical protein [Dechloromonas sp.]